MTLRWPSELGGKNIYNIWSSERTIPFRTVHGLTPDRYISQAIQSRSSWMGVMNLSYPGSLMQEHLAKGTMTGCWSQLRRRGSPYFRFHLCLLIKNSVGTCFISLSVKRYLGSAQIGGGGYSHTVVLSLFYLFYSCLL